MADTASPMLLGHAVRIERGLQRRRERWALAALVRRLAQESTYSFTTDYVSSRTSDWVRHLAEFRGAPGVGMLEVGSFEGRSALWFLDNVLTHPASRLTCVDLFVHPQSEARFDHNMRVAGAAERVRKIRGGSDTVLPSLAGSAFDVVYVDGSHRAVHVLMDGVWSWKLLKPGGVLIFDDYLWEPDLPAAARPQMAVDLFLEIFEGRCEVVGKAYQVVVRKPVA